MRKRYITVLAGIVFSMMFFTGCGSRQAAERETQLQSEINELRQEIDDLRSGQDGQDADAQAQAPADDAQAGDAEQPADNAQAGGNTEQPADNAQGNSGQNAPSGNGRISMEEARNIALARVEGATASNISIELDEDDGWYVYEGEIFYNGMEYEFEIDADSGNILKWEEERW